MHGFRKSLLIALVCCALPVAAVLFGDLLASLSRCRVDEIAVPCVLGGVSVGPVVRGLAGLGWLALAAVSTGGALLLFWALAEAAQLMGKRRRNS